MSIPSQFLTTPGRRTSQS